MQNNQIDEDKQNNSKTKYIAFGSIMSLNFFRFSILSIFIASFPLIKQEFDLTNVQLSYISTVYYLFSLVFSYLWTFLSGKYSNRLVLIIGAMFWILPLFYFPYISTFSVLILITILIGTGTESVAVVLNNFFISLNFDKQFAKAYSFRTIVQGAGGVFGTFLVGQLSKFSNMGWRNIFFIIGIFSLILFLITYFMFFSKHIKDKPNSFEEKKYVLNFQKLKEIYNNSANRLISTAIFVSVFSITYLNIWIQLYFTEVHNVPHEIAIISFIYLSGIEFLGFIFSGVILDYLKKKNITRFKYFGPFAYGLSGLFFLIGFSIPWSIESIPGNNFIELCFNLLIQVLSDFPTTAAYLSLTFGFFTYTVIDPYFASMINYHNEENNKKIMLNINNGIIILSYLVGPMIGGYLADMFGFIIVFYNVPLGIFLSLIPIFILAKKKPSNSSLEGIPENQSM